MIRRRHSLPGSLWLIGVLLLAGCGFHLRQSAALPPAMAQQVYLQFDGEGAFHRSLAASLRASGVQVLEASAPGVATLKVPVARFSSRLLTTGGIQKVGEYSVGMHVRFSLVDGAGSTIIPAQDLELAHEFAVDQRQYSAISSETEAIQRSLVREMTAAVMRRLEAHADAVVAPTPVPAQSG